MKNEYEQRKYGIGILKSAVLAGALTLGVLVSEGCIGHSYKPEGRPMIIYDKKGKKVSKKKFEKEMGELVGVGKTLGEIIGDIGEEMREELNDKHEY